MGSIPGRRNSMGKGLDTRQYGTIEKNYFGWSRVNL
jgi:hypothetical protein